jgi:hypothetical protein
VCDREREIRSRRFDVSDIGDLNNFTQLQERTQLCLQPRKKGTTNAVLINLQKKHYYFTKFVARSKFVNFNGGFK